MRQELVVYKSDSLLLYTFDRISAFLTFIKAMR